MVGRLYSDDPEIGKKCRSFGDLQVMQKIKDCQDCPDIIYISCSAGAWVNFSK
jgi:hypothetical protein